MVVKVSQKNLVWNGYCGAEDEISLSWFDADKVKKAHNQSKSDKITLSVKVGKKRQLLKGQLIYRDQSCPESGRTVYVSFKPNNLEKASKLVIGYIL